MLLSMAMTFRLTRRRRSKILFMIEGTIEAQTLRSSDLKYIGYIQRKVAAIDGKTIISFITKWE